MALDEMENESTETESGANEGASPDASSGDTGSGQGAAPGAESNKEQQVPFHEHPRFKELVEQKNQAITAQRQLEQQYQTLQKQIETLRTPAQPAGKTEFDTLIEDLKKVDPRLAAALEQQARAAKESEALKSRLDSFEKQSQESSQKQAIQATVSKINTLHEANKVSPELKQMINDKLDLMYMQGKLNFADVDNAYKGIHDGFKKFEDALKRSVTESYVQDKKKDAAVPTSQPRGAPAKPAPKKPQWSGDKETARAQVVNRYLKQVAAAKEAGNT